jgi:hypothetical protein
LIWDVERHGAKKRCGMWDVRCGMPFTAYCLPFTDVVAGDKRGSSERYGIFVKVEKTK